MFPGRTADKMLPGELGDSVNVQWVGSVLFHVGTILDSVEHIVGADVHQSGAQFFRDEGEISGADCIDGQRLLRIALAILHMMHRACIYDHVRPSFAEGLGNRVNFGDFDLLMRQRQRRVAILCESGDDIVAQLPVGADHYDFHFHSTFDITWVSMPLSIPLNVPMLENCGLSQSWNLSMLSIKSNTMDFKS